MTSRATSTKPEHALPERWPIDLGPSGSTLPAANGEQRERRPVPGAGVVLGVVGGALLLVIGWHFVARWLA